MEETLDLADWQPLPTVVEFRFRTVGLVATLCERSGKVGEGTAQVYENGAEDEGLGL